MTFIDSHTHLFSDQFNKDINQVISRAKALDINGFVLPNINLESVPNMLDLVDKYPDSMFPAIGLHPCDVKESFEEDLEKIEEYLSKSPDTFCAIGEIGMDLYWDKRTLENQKKAFKTQVEWAKRYQKPIIIHARDSFDELFESLDELNDEKLKGVFHCFTGSLQQANKVIEYGGFKLGLGGVLTFKNSGLDKVVEQIDLKHIILETDSPYLAPTPHRGKRNESAYLIHVAEKLAHIHQKKLSEISSITTKNTRELFSLTKLKTKS